MSDFENDFENDFDADFDSPPALDLVDEAQRCVDPRLRPYPTLRRAGPSIDFSGQYSTVGSNINSSLSSGIHRPRIPSHTSSSTLRSSLNPSTAHLFSQKMYDPFEPQSPDVPLSVITSLTIDQLRLHPHHRLLQQNYDHLCKVLSDKRGESRVAQSDIDQDMYQAPHDNNARASSLGPSDSASQQRTDISFQRLVEGLLARVEAPVDRPSFLPVSVLWDYEDCKKSTTASGAAIVTKQNKRRPKMNHTIRCGNGNVVSHEVYVNIRTSADIILKKLITSLDLKGSAPRTKTFIKSNFPSEYRKALLDLEKDQTILRLCSGHWKADSMFTQAFMRRNNAEGKAAKVDKRAAPLKPNPSHPLDAAANASQPPDSSHAVLTPHVPDVAPMNAAKRAFVMSPGPKSPSASHTQKRSKDDAMPSAQRTMGSLVPKPRRLPVPKMLASFLSRTEEARTEPAPPVLRPIYVDPSVDNLVAILTSEFPMFTTAPSLLHSMNMQRSFKPGPTSENVTTLLARLQNADPGAPDLDEDSMGISWGHDQYTAGGLGPSSSLTSWQDVGSVATTFELVAAAIKTCQEARLMCVNAGAPKAGGYISDVYLGQTLEYLENCWVGAGGIQSQTHVPVVPTSPSSHDVAMMSPPRTLTIKLRRPGTSDVASIATNISDAPAATDIPDSTSPQEPAASTESSAVLTEGARADAALLKTLQVLELQAWITTHGVSMPKSKKKDVLIAVISDSPAPSQPTKSDVAKIIGERKPKKGAST